ncbi:MAG: LPXTG cell wall anchor domain-containing protein [Clostridia bacterium]|nr:LPXTG cell wall anchor domain-containing protein [Clostridia bacterium]
MKKVLTICLAIIMVFAMSISVCAAPGSFVESPSNNGAPTLIEYINDDPTCTAILKIYSYAQRNGLLDVFRKEMENAYNTIHDTLDLTTICNSLTDVANEKNIRPTDLKVSDLFFIDMTDCDIHSEHGRFKIKLSADTLKGFTGLMQFVDGKWVMVSGATIEDGNYLTFKTDVPSTFAIVVDSTRAVATSPKTGDPSGYVMLALAGVAVVAMAATGIVVYTKKKHE